MIIKAIGIHSISDEIPAVKISHFPELLHLPNTTFRRGKGQVDLLIGIDHAHVHAGETKQVDNLLARRSPLGWVAFGGKPEQTGDVTKYAARQVCLTSGLNRFLGNRNRERGCETLCLRCRQADPNEKRRS